MDFKHPLNTSHFTFLDRLKICAFFLNRGNRWTQGDYVRKYEEAWEKYTRAKHVVMTSSGSTANTLIAQYQKDHFGTKKIVVFPAVTWVTSVSPWIREGFQPHFIDINLENLSMDLDKLEVYLKENSQHVNCVFVTSLLGFTPDIHNLLTICAKYSVKLKLDNCENSFGLFLAGDIDHHICSLVTSSTSCYFGHQVTTGSEGGFIFTNNFEEYCYYLMARSHGMARVLLEEKLYDKHLECKNYKVDPRFDFYLLGNNFRSTNIAAYMGLLDFKRIEHTIRRRKYLYEIFENTLDETQFWRVEHRENTEHIPFCLPIILNPALDNNFKLARISWIKYYCSCEKIETRPIISGNLLRQRCFSQFDDYNNFPNAEHIHRFGLYVGLYPKLTEKQVYKLAKEISVLKKL